MTESALRPALGYMFLTVGSKSTLINSPEKIVGFTAHRDAIYLAAQNRGLEIEKVFLDHNTYKNASPFDQSQFVDAQALATRANMPLIVANFFQLASRYPWEKAIARTYLLRNSEIEFIDGVSSLPLKLIEKSTIEVLLFQATRVRSSHRRSARKGAKSASQNRMRATEAQPRRQATTAARTLTADMYAVTMSPLIQNARSELPPTQRENYTAIAKRLNNDGLYTRTGRPWIGQQVKRTLERAEKVKKKRRATRKKS